MADDAVMVWHPHIHTLMGQHTIIACTLAERHCIYASRLLEACRYVEAALYKYSITLNCLTYINPELMYG